MKTLAAGLVLLPAILLAAIATAQENGPWHVTGKISGVAFAIDCRFEPQGAKLGGACVDATSGDPRFPSGAVHRLTRGTQTASQLSWTYQSKFLLYKFDVNFTGKVEGNHMAGTINAGGRSGDFTAFKN